MAESVNEVHIKGEVVRDPRHGAGRNGSPYCFATIVTSSRKFKDYHNVSAFGDEAKALREARKGDVVEIFGFIQYKKVEGQQYVQEASIVPSSVELFPKSGRSGYRRAEETESHDDIPF